MYAEKEHVVQTAICSVISGSFFTFDMDQQRQLKERALPGYIWQTHWPPQNDFGASFPVNRVENWKLKKIGKLKPKNRKFGFHKFWLKPIAELFSVIFSY